MSIIALFMILAAPIAQIIWSNSRLKHKTQIPLAGIVVMMAILGVGLSIGAFYLLCSQIPPANGHGVCVTGETAFMFMGCFIAIIIVPVIGFIFGLIYRFKHHQSESNDEASTRVNKILAKHYK